LKISKKCIVLLPIVIGLILIITACGAEVDEPEERFEDNDSASENYKDDDDAKEEEDMDKVDGNYFSQDVKEDEALKNWIEGKKHEEGEYQYPEDERIYMIAAGERNTGGYSVQIIGEERDGEDLTISYRINAPGPDDIVTQAITYPYLLVEVAEDIGEVSFMKK